MRITAVRGTDLFVGSATAARQVVRVTMSGPRASVRVRVEGKRVFTPEPVTADVHPDGVTVEVGVVFQAPEGSEHRVTVVAESAGQRVTAEADLVVAETGWTMWMVSHFHYDPVWWNTQAGFTDTWLDLPLAQEKRMNFQRSAFDLVRAHLEAARDDEDYRFVLAEVDYLKPHWDTFPEDRATLGRFIRDGRVELVGGNYNEANTNLTHPESTIRNAVYGVGYQRDVLGADPRSAWMLDVFGHDPAYPGLMADAGLDSSAWARGPWHHVGAKRHTGDIGRMQFPSEFEWIAPSGRGLLTAYMADHYVAGWALERRDTLAEAMEEAYRQFSTLRQVAATRNVLLPVGHDHNIPSRFCTEIHREWNARYVWPRFVVGLPREFFAAVRADAAARGTVISPQTRDMNPVYTGKDVSYIDTKQAQRAAEVSVLDGERLATLATLLGARYPHEALDKAWRQLVYGAHHDAVTGTESDQVYLDLLTGWREADELGREVLAGSIGHLAGHVDTAGEGTAVLAVNSLSFPRDAVTTVTVTFAEPGVRGARVADPAGRDVPAVAEGPVRHPDGTLAELTLTFLARQVPALGYRVYRVLDAPTVPPGWERREGRVSIENEAFLVEADPARGGALCSIRDRRDGRELLRPGGLGAELVLQAEHSEHPVWGEGPWHLLPKGPGHGTGARPAEVVVETCALGARIVAKTTLAGLEITQETTLWQGIPRVDVRSHVDGSIGRDHLLRARFDFDVPGALPVAEVGFAAVGRSFGFPDVDAAEHLWTLDSPAHTWAGLSATARIALTRPDGTRTAHAIGVAELVEPGDGHLAGPVRALMAALVAKGVTATCTRPGGQRYGALDVDSNLPDVRIVLGAGNPVADAVLETVGARYRAALAEHGRVFVPATRTRREAWGPDADLRGPRDLPVLIVDGPDPVAAIEALTADLADACVEVPLPEGLDGTNEPADGYSVAVVNHGTPGFVVDPAGSFHLSLMRACGGWPSGVWIDGERRTVPDGSSFAWQHWTHTFAFSLLAGEGDWRQAGFARAAQDVSHPLWTGPVASGAGDLPRELSLISVEPAQVLLTAVKPAGNPLAVGEPARPGTALTLRIYDSAGAPVTATVAVHGGVRSAARTDLLEEGDGRPLAIDGDRLRLDLAAADVATLRLDPARRVPDSEVDLARTREPVQPVFTRYWLHNAGPAPLGNLPVSVHVTPTRSRLAENGSAELGVTVSCSGRAAKGTVELVVPPGWRATAPADVGYRLEPGEHARFTVALRAPDTPGQFVLAARIRDDLGQTLEDTAEFVVGERAAGDLFEVDLGVEAVDLTPGGTVFVPVFLNNPAHSEVHGEVTLVSPYGTWGAPVSAGPRTQPFTVAAGARTTVSLRLAASATARVGAHWWALVRVAAHGRLHYSRSVAIRVVGPSGDVGPNSSSNRE
ncbi:glycoside hydrolase family 38 C-terminal domain-containing protein [Amycolatopsis sp. NPDC051128]|uniref:glycoside hydrolase family 38 N-terminal domain-containing protein n=1 Tax=Amycolatopsis sp. NPDC051128 TaxID=3155412 RepID=UPI00341309A9